VTLPSPGSVDVSVVCAVYNEDQGVDRLVEGIAAVLPAVAASHEIVIVDDGSSDDTLAKLKRCTHVLPTLRVVELTRNFGQVGALGAGLTVARGRYLVTMDGDLQHDPQDIPRLVLTAQQGHDLVATYRTVRVESVKRRIVTWVGNRVNFFFTGLDVRDFGSTFRVLGARIVDALRDGTGRVHYNTPLLYALARRPVQLPITQHKRAFGSTKWTFTMFVAYNLDFLTASLRLVHLILAVSFVAFAAATVLYLLKLLGVFAHVEAASAPAMIALSALQLALLAVVWREVIQAQRFAKGVPPFVIHQIWSTGGAASDARPEAA